MMASCICGQYGGCAGKQIPANNQITKANLLVVRDKLAIEIKTYHCTSLQNMLIFFCKVGRFNMGICGGCLTFRSDSSGRSRNCSFWCFTLNLKCSTSKLQPKLFYFWDLDALVGLSFPPLNMKNCFCRWLLITRNFEGVTQFLAFLATWLCQKSSCFHKLKQKINK